MIYQRAFRLSLLCLALILASISPEHAFAQRLWEPIPGSLYIGFPSDTGYGLTIDTLANTDTLVRTTNGGKSWQQVELPIDSHSFWGGGSYPMLPGNLSFVGPIGWLLAGTPGGLYGFQHLLKTTDYGFTWSTLSMDSTLGADNIIFKSQSLGYLAAGGSLYITRDGGQTWQHQGTGPPSGGYSIIGYIYLDDGPANVIEGTGYVSSKDPGTYYPYVSTDAGETWYPVYEPMDWYIGRDIWITFHDRTTDYGQTWNPVPTTAYIYGGYLITDTLGHGMFTGYDGHSDSVLYFTTDYGSTWDSVNVPFAGINNGLIVDNTWYVEYEGQLYRSPPALGSVAQTSQTRQFQILTNPAAHVLQLSLEEIPDEIRIVDFLGRTVGNYSTQGGAFSVDVSALPAGLYWVVTRSGAQSFVHLTE
jgi:photosystem II stability/assembly factor-like uncharacterized protein